MKFLNLRGQSINNPLLFPIFSILFFTLIYSCQPDENELGRDILPAGDNIFVFYDTLNSITSFPVQAKPFVTSENYLNPQPNRFFLLGNIRDTISGFTAADIVTQFNPTLSFEYAPNMEVDSLLLSLYFVNTQTKGGIENAIISIHELTERIYMDSVYYSDYDMSGKYDPVPLAEKTVLLTDSMLVEFLIVDEDYINKFIYPQTDTLFRYDSLFKDWFKGFYITSQSIGNGGFLSNIHLAKTETRVSIKYANDSTDVDTIPGPDFVWRYFSINEYSSQKMNIFHHDFSGTSFEQYIDNPETESPILYVQGLNGINTKIHLGNADLWSDSGLVAINNAHLDFEVIPDSLSGINFEDLPARLIMFVDMGDYIERVYDYVIDESKFDGRLRAVSEGVFYDTTYVYRFNIGLHYQSIINGDIGNYDLILKPYDFRTNNNFVKLWSNYSRTQGRLRLKVVYTKL